MISLVKKYQKERKNLPAAVQYSLFSLQNFENHIKIITPVNQLELESN